MTDYLYNLPNATSGVDALAIQTFSSFPWMSVLLLMFIFLVVFIGGMTRQKIRSGTADYPAWAVIASIATLLPALLMSVTAGFIRLDWLLIVIALNIMSAIWFFLDRKTSEI
jgi:uncharacterized membrane protein